MTKLLLTVHVLAVILTIGPVSVAASMYPAFARTAVAGPDPSTDRLQVLHRICRVYSVVAVAVPAFGIATGQSMGVLTSPWLLASLGLTALASVVLSALILPTQCRILRLVSTLDPAPLRDVTVRLAMITGVFNLLWVAVTVLMIVRPGSTTGV